MSSKTRMGLQRPEPVPSGTVRADRGAPRKVEGFVQGARQGLPNLSVVIPSFNEAENLAELLPRLPTMLDGLVPAWEVVLVDDGSHDETGKLLDEWCRQPGFRAIQLSRNFGKEAAITAGLDHAHGDAAVIMDADLQHPPELIAEMIKGWCAGYDIVYTVRSRRQDEGLLKRAFTRMFYRLVNIGSRFPIPTDAGDFRLMDRAVVEAMRQLPERNRFMKGLYAWSGFRSMATPYEPAARGAGKSSFNLRKLTTLALDGVTAFTIWPLRMVSWIGFGLAVASIGYGTYLVFEKLLVGNNEPGWTTIVVALMLLSGIQLVAIGVLGEYVARIFIEVKGRPSYVIRHQSGEGLKGEKS